MLVTVIRPFPFSRDGRTSLQAVASPEPQDIPDALVPGLISEGYIDPAGHPPVPFSAGRRRVMVDRFSELFRAHLETLSDDALAEGLASAEAQVLTNETKVIGDLEQGQPELFEALAEPSTHAPPTAEQAAPSQDGQDAPLPAFDPNTADEAALRAFLTERDGKEPDGRLGVEKLRALALATPAPEGAGE